MRGALAIVNLSLVCAWYVCPAFGDIDPAHKEVINRMRKFIPETNEPQRGASN